jgi:hypothetical protein
MGMMLSLLMKLWLRCKVSCFDEYEDQRLTAQIEIR